MPTVELPLLRPVARGRERGAVHFTVASTVRQFFCCKTAQFCATLRETQTAETPSVGDAVQRSENTRTDKGLVAFLKLTAPSLGPHPVDASLIRMLPCLARAVILSTVSVQWLECNQHYAGARRSTATFLTIILYFDSASAGTLKRTRFNVSAFRVTVTVDAFIASAAHSGRNRSPKDR
jgi:hypothetical protein